MPFSPTPRILKFCCFRDYYIFPFKVDFWFFGPRFCYRIYPGFFPLPLFCLKNSLKCPESCSQVLPRDLGTLAGCVLRAGPPRRCQANTPWRRGRMKRSSKVHRHRSREGWLLQLHTSDSRVSWDALVAAGVADPWPAIQTGFLALPGFCKLPSTA